MSTDWDVRFDLLIGVDIRDCDAEPCLDSGVHDLICGATAQDAKAHSFPKPSTVEQGRHVMEWIRDRGALFEA